MKIKKDVLRAGITVPNVKGESITITEDYLKRLVENTEATGHKPFVPFQHSQDPRDNTGFVYGWEIEDGVLYMIAEVEDEVAEKFNKTIKGVSLETIGKPENGGYINHASLTVHPVLKDQGPFLQLEADMGDIEIRGGEEMAEVELTAEGQEGLANRVITGVKDLFVTPDGEKLAELRLEHETLQAENEKTLKEKAELELELGTYREKDEEATKTAWDERWNKGIDEGRVLPKQRELILEKFPTVDELELYLETVEPENKANLETAKEEEKPGDEKGIKAETPDVQKLVEGAGYDKELVEEVLESEKE